MGLPLTVDNDWKRFDRCDDGCDNSCEFDDSDPDIITKPCCSRGCCKHCAVIGGDAPYLVPKAVACGRTRKRAVTIPNLMQIQGDMPGRGAHTLMCVRGMGVQNVTYFNTTQEGYEINIRFDIPIEITLKDCCGFVFTVKSTIKAGTVAGVGEVKIPLGMKAKYLGDGGGFLYIKTKVRLCEPVDNITANAAVNLNILVEACAMRFIPYGITGDPSTRTGPYFCD